MQRYHLPISCFPSLLYWICPVNTGRLRYGHALSISHFKIHVFVYFSRKALSIHSSLSTWNGNALSGLNNIILHSRSSYWHFQQFVKITYLPVFFFQAWVTLLGIVPNLPEVTPISKTEMGEKFISVANRCHLDITPIILDCYFQAYWSVLKDHSCGSEYLPIWLLSVIMKPSFWNQKANNEEKRLF